MAVHHTTVREFSRDDINFVQAIAHIVAQVIERRDTEQELKAARDEALASAHAKSAFLANMSHEIRTPLNAIVGLTGLLLETALSAEQRDFAETIRVSSDVLLDTINNVLDFTKLSTGKLVLEHTEFDMRTIIQTAVDILAGAAHEKNLELALSMDGQVPNVLRGDPGRLRQVLVNLLSNAVKFTEHGEVVVRVTLEGEAEKKALIRFAVSDTGVGTSAGNATPALPTLLPGRQLHHAQIWRQRTGPGDLGATGGVDGRPDRRDQPAGRRGHLLVHCST